jgi:hypothetical protein
LNLQAVVKHAFRARLEPVAGVSSLHVPVPAKIMQAFAPRKRVPVTATVNGFAFRTTICDMGAGPMIGFNAAVRKGARLTAGDVADLVVELDTAKRTVTAPPDLLAAMGTAERERFTTLSYTHQREFVQAIEDAKKPETRRRRIEKTIETIRAKMPRTELAANPKKAAKPTSS